MSSGSGFTRSNDLPPLHTFHQYAEAALGAETTERLVFSGIR